MHHFKTEVKKYNFNSYTAAIHTFAKDLWNAHNITEKIYEWDPQILTEVIKLVENSIWPKKLQLPWHPLQ